jgi:hypothetical protein
MRVKFPKFFGSIFFFVFCAIILSFSIRGLPGNPDVTELRTGVWRENGPFELSPERGRFTLLYSIIENNSFSFSRELAFFAEPDVAYMDGRYVSLFAPGLSFIVMPGYLIGKYFGAAQVGTFAVIAFFALLNVFLIRQIAIRLGAHQLAATIAGFGFLFATPAYAYAVNLYQHHVSTFFILLSVFLLIRFNNFWSLSLIWMLCVFSVVIDYPNFFMLLPIGIFALSRLFFINKTKTGSVSVTFSIIRVFTFIGVILPILFFCWANIMSYGKPFQLAGALERPVKINADGTPVLASKMLTLETSTSASLTPLPQDGSGSNTGVIAFFVNRNIMNGFHTHFISGDRGIIVYTPLMIFSCIGIYIAWKRRLPYFALLIAIIGFNVLLYSLWGDPYGGWAFGSRYLIPSYAILSLFIAIALTFLIKNNLFLLLFFIIFVYSLVINTLGAITSSRNPPRIEVANLENLSGTKQHSTYLRNVEFLMQGKSKSFIFQAVGQKYISAWQYYIILTVISIGGLAVLLILLQRTINTGGHHGL